MRYFRWIVSIFRFHREPPELREVPVLLLKASIWGLLSGPFFALFFLLLGRPAQIAGFIRAPVVIFWSAIIGAVWSLAFYICCGLGNRYLRGWTRGYPASIASTVSVLFNIVASSLAFVTAVGISNHLPGGMIHLEVPYFWRVVLIDGLAGGLLAIVVRAFIRLKTEVERTHAALNRQELETARAQAQALQSQINPHFFFNTLNTISALVDDDRDAARQIIGRLADMFRYTLSCTHHNAVGLEEELQFVRDYLAIEQARFRQRLRVEMPDEPVSDIRVPGLVLQPLVENAVKHGIARRIEGGTVSVRVTRNGKATRVCVRNTADDFDPVEPGSLYRAGHALENVRARLRIFTGQADPLHMSRTAEWTEFSFEIGAV